MLSVSTDIVDLEIGMSGFCDSASTKFCAELTNVCRIGRYAQN